MDLKTFGLELAKIGLPLLGAALPCPGGAALGAALASQIGAKSSDPADLLATLTGNAQALEQAKQFETTHVERMLDLTTQAEIAERKADSADLVAVNATMQQEAANAAAENWFQKGWRPFNGYIVGLASLVAVVAVCFPVGYAMMANPANIAVIIPQLPALAFNIGIILGVPGAAVGITAWHRGQLQREQVKGAA